MTPAKPSLDLLRSLTDQHVLQALIAERRLTRAEIAARTGISKPTVGESVRRLTEAGLLCDTGERTTGRGRVGTYYAIAADVGTALAVSIAPEGVLAEAVDVHGDVLAREVGQVERPAHPEQVAQTLRTVVARALEGASVPARLAVVSAADPVDRSTGRLVHLPDAPFLVGELFPTEVLAPLVAGPVTVDNDVNWAARAERAAANRLDDFAYLYLGEGLGCAVVADGQVRRGHSGLAGEIAHLLTRGPGGRAVAFTDVFAELQLRQPGSPAVDVAALLHAVDADRGASAAHPILPVLAEAICGVLAAVVALTDPQLVVVGGPWGTDPTVLEAVSGRFVRLPRHVPLRPARVVAEPAHSGARGQALRELQAAVLAPQHSAEPGTARSPEAAF